MGRHSRVMAWALAWTLGLLVPSHGLGAIFGSGGGQRGHEASEGTSGSGASWRNRLSRPAETRAPVLLGGTRERGAGGLRRQLQQQEWVKEEVNMVGLVKELEGELEASTPCNHTMLEEMRAFFSKIVLIVHCNDDSFLPNTTAFWRKVYAERLFEHVVFVAANPDPSLGVEARAPRPWRWDWHYSYFGLPKIMARFPSAEGFLWSSDNVIINYWNLLKADKTKLWLPNDPAHPETRHFPIDNDTESRWPQDWPSLPQHRAQAAAAWALLQWKQRRQYRDSVGSPPEGPVWFQKRVCDLFYIPQRLVEAFSFDLLPFFREARVASQLALPTMFYMLDHPSSFDPVLDDMDIRWDQPQAKRFPRQVWIPDVSGLRPWKVTDAQGQKDALLLLSQRDSCVLDQFMSRDKGSA